MDIASWLSGGGVVVRRWRSISFDPADLPGPARRSSIAIAPRREIRHWVSSVLFSAWGAHFNCQRSMAMCYEERFFSRRTDKKVRKSERPDALTGRVPPQAHSDRPKPEMTAPKRPERELETV